MLAHKNLRSISPLPRVILKIKESNLANENSKSSAGNKYSKQAESYFSSKILYSISLNDPEAKAIKHLQKETAIFISICLVEK